MMLASRFIRRRPLGNPWSDTLLLNMFRSNADYTVSESTSSNAAAMTLRGRTTGKYYWECDPDNLGGVSFDCAVGIRRSDEPIATAVNLGKTLAMRSTGTLFAGDTGASTGTGVTFASGNRLMFALDLGAAKFWIGKAGTWANSGDPAAGSNPLFSGFPAGDWRPYFWVDNNATNHGNDLMNGQLETAFAFGFTPPDGFERGIRF